MRSQCICEGRAACAVWSQRMGGQVGVRNVCKGVAECGHNIGVRGGAYCGREACVGDIVGSQGMCEGGPAQCNWRGLQGEGWHGEG